MNVFQNKIIDHSSFIISSLIISISYFIISGTLTYFYFAKGKTIKNRYMILLFITFISLCGLIHLTSILVIYYPMQRLLVFLKSITAGVSLMTALMLPKVIRDILTYRSPEEYKIIEQQFLDLIEEKKKLLERIQEINHGLANRIQYLENMLASHEWLSKNQMKLQELKNIVQDLRNEYK